MTLFLKHWIKSGQWLEFLLNLSNSIGGRLRDSKFRSSKAIVNEDWSMVVFITVYDPSIKVSIKESIEQLVSLLHNFVVCKIDNLRGGVRGGMGM